MRHVALVALTLAVAFFAALSAYTYRRMKGAEVRAVQLRESIDGLSERLRRDEKALGDASADARSMYQDVLDRERSLEKALARH